MATRIAALAELFAHARDGMYIGHLDSSARAAAGVTVAANPALQRILGYPPETPEAAVLLFAPTHYVDADSRAHLMDTLLSEGAVTDFPLQLRQSTGATVWVEMTAHVDEHRRVPLRVDALVRDVGSRRQREERTRHLYQQFAESEQLAAIGRTLADVAHELRNPLSTIVAWAERLASQPSLDEPVRRGVTEILSASERAARITRNALHSTGQRQSTRAMMNLNSVVADTLSLRQHDQRALNVTAIMELGADIPAVFADAHQIQQVLLNIVINAEQSMTEAHNRGTLTVRTSCDRRNGMAIVEIGDDGPGVPESVRSRIFDPFFTTKQPGAGTGLGLAVAQALAHEHGGSIRLTHDVKPGATFLIELPTRAPHTTMT